jgi:GTPase SAR1 family protein
MQQNLDPQTVLENLRQILETLTAELSPLFGDDSVQVGSWRRSIEAVSESLQDQTLRIAVVGPVKAGKSTFINALQGRDLLKRGAGIITAFITRIRSGSEVKGWVEIKSWHEINAEVNEALSMIALTRGSERAEPVDLRREEERISLQQFMQEAKQENLLGRETFDPNMVLINGYLKGYSELSVHVRDEPVRLEFSAEDLERHQDFVGQESQAVYLRDMELQLPISWLGEMVELGDCQGSDSPNPLHFAMLQEYLLSSHCILYLISSRIGIRQADLKLIEAIKILRLLPQTLFVLNVDIDEHGDMGSLEGLQERVAAELRLLVPDAKIYGFSALLQLLQAADGEEDLSSRERRRLAGWHEDAEMVEFSRRGYELFCNDLKHLVRRERSGSLYAGVLSHLQRVTQSMKDSVNTRTRLLSKDQEELKALADEIKRRQQSVTAALNTVEHTLGGLRSSLKEQVRSAVDSYFDTQYGPIINDTMRMVENYKVDNFTEIKAEETRKWLTNLYFFYQDFRQMLARHIIDKVNLRIIDFAKSEEEYIESKLMEAATGYWDLMGRALRQYQQTLTDSGLTLSLVAPEALPQPKKPSIAPPPFSAFLQRSEGLGRGSILLRFGIRRLGQVFSGLKSRVLRRDTVEPAGSNKEILQEAVALVKKETQKELLESFKDYRQNFKFAYLFSYTERYTQGLIQLFRDFGDATMVDIGHLQEAAHKRASSQDDTTEDLAIVNHRLKYAEEHLRNLEESLGSWS